MLFSIRIVRVCSSEGFLQFESSPSSSLVVEIRLLIAVLSAMETVVTQLVALASVAHVTDSRCNSPDGHWET